MQRGISQYKGVSFICSKCRMEVKREQAKVQVSGPDPKVLYYNHNRCENERENDAER